MNPFAWSGLLAGVFSSGLGLLVLAKSPNRKLGRIWFIFALSVAVWGFGSMWIGLAKTPTEGLLAWRLAYAFGVIWIPVLFYQFVCIFCELERKMLVAAHYIVGIAALCMMPTNFFFFGVRWDFNSIYIDRGGPVFPYYVLWWLMSVLFSHVELIRAYQRATPDKKNQIKHFFLATAIGYCGGSLDFLPALGVKLYPWGNFAIFLYPIIMSYAILKYRLMDIKIVIRRAGLITLIYVVLASLLIPIGWSSYPGLIAYRWGFPLAAIICGMVLSVGPFIYARLIRQSAFFQERVVSGVTHEFKSPLAAIQSATGILMNQLEKLPQGNPFDAIRSKQADYLLMIQNNSQRLEKFIQELLAVTKIEHGKPELKLEEGNLKEICSKVIELYKPLAQQKNIKLQFIANGIKPIHCDPEKMQMVISNLLSNAIKFTDQGHIEVSIDQSVYETTVRVSDTGIGIPQEDMPHIFDKFYQGKNGNGTKGTGLGLSIVKGWVEAHGGRVVVESKGEGAGTRFLVSLPRGKV
jgi:signal transduction histidine kinase